jgi:uncharacterized membrane protein
MIPFPIQVLLFAAVGVAMEVVFTAFMDLPKTRSARLLGYSYVWMLPIYALAPILLRVLTPAIGLWALGFRILVYVALLYIVEYTAGLALRLATGACPWEAEYRGHRWAVHGLIRLDFAPAWAVACLLFERLYFVLNGAGA